MIHQKIEEKFKPKRVRFCPRLHEAYESKEALQLLFDELKRAPKQSEVIMRILSLNPKERLWQKVDELKSDSDIKSSTIKVLIDKDILEESYQEVFRELYPGKELLEEKKELSKAQTLALDKIMISFKEKQVVLFEGVTSSGKTEVYIKLIEEQLGQNKQVLYLVLKYHLLHKLSID